MQQPTAPELVVNSRMLSVSWWPAEAARVAAMLPADLHPPRDLPVAMTQYVVDSSVQTSSLGAHSATLLGVDLDHVGAGGRTPTRLWLYALASTPAARRFFAARGLATEPARTAIAFRGESVVATTEHAGETLIRATAHVGPPTLFEAGRRAHLRMADGHYLDEVEPWIATLADPWSLADLRFESPDHPVWAMRPADDVQVLGGFYAPNASFCFSGGATIVSPPAPTWSEPWRGRSPY